MNALELRRHLADPRRLVAQLGLERGLKAQGRGVIICCPVHDDSTPSCSVRVATDGTIAAKCHGCGWSGDALSLIAAAHRLDVRGDFAKVANLAAELAGIEQLPRSSRICMPRPRATTPPERKRPKLTDILSSCGAVAFDVELVGLLRSRAIAPDIVTDRQLAFALIGKPPRWAGHRVDDRHLSWLESGHRLIVPMYGATGELESIHARRLSRDGDDAKGLSPAGCSHAGLVFADPMARQLLMTGTAPDWWTDRTIVIAEGVPDFLTWAVHYGDSEDAPAVIGVVAGSWTPEIAARIPAGTRVEVRTHDDAAGNKYAAAIAQSLVERCDVYARPEVMAR